MLYVVEGDYYLQHSEIYFLKNSLPEYPDALERESFYTIDDKTLESTPDDFEKVTSPEVIMWLGTQSTWLLFESQSAATSTEHLKEAAKRLKDDLAYVYGGKGYVELNWEQQLEKLKRKHKIKAINRVLESREDPEKAILYPAS